MYKPNTATKILYGFGFSARGIKDGLFQLFLFFYFSQVLGLDAALAGTASIIALLFDAVSDPLIGVVSDRWKSEKWGRRHPFMFASALPLGLFIYLLFLPPEGMAQTGLFIWLTVFSILVRLALTLFLIPAMSLGAELSTDYNERTSITSYRIMFAAFVAPFVIIFGLLTFFKPTGTMTNGLFNAEAYPKFAILCGVLATIFILISTYFTRHTIPHLPKMSAVQESYKLASIVSNFKSAFQLKSFKTLVAFVMMINIGIGVGTVFIPYYTTYFFGLSERELAAMPVASAVGGLVALFLTPAMGKLLDKKRAAIISTVLFAAFFSLPFSLRLLNLFPQNGDVSLLPTYLGLTTIGYLFIFVAIGLAHSMMADVVDEYTLSTGTREEGMFFSSMSFAYKCTVGLGYFIAGLLLNWISFPKQVELAGVSQKAIDGLGYIGGPVSFFIYFSSIFLILFYPINKQRYNEIRAGLNKQ